MTDDSSDQNNHNLPNVSKDTGMCVANLAAHSACSLCSNLDMTTDDGDRKATDASSLRTEDYSQVSSSHNSCLTRNHRHQVL